MSLLHSVSLRPTLNRLHRRGEANMGRSPNVRLAVGVLVIEVLGMRGGLAAAPPGSAPSGAPVMTALLSVASDGASGNGNSFDPAVSADASAVAFTSV